jgi:4-carboxymuconolactone decarboxylase
MDELNLRDKELVAIGAAIGSNCIPCIVYHIKEARACGVSDWQIRAAIEVAENVRKVPFELVKNTAYAHLDVQPKESADRDDSAAGDCGCGSHCL